MAGKNVKSSSLSCYKKKSTARCCYFCKHAALSDILINLVPLKKLVSAFDCRFHEEGKDNGI